MVTSLRFSFLFLSVFIPWNIGSMTSMNRWWPCAALGMRKGFCTLWNIKCSLSFIDSEFAGFLCSFSRFYRAFIKFSNRAKTPNERQGISGYIYEPERFTSDRWKMTPETSSEQKTRVRVFRNGTRQLTRTATEQFHFAGLFLPQLSFGQLN